VVVVAVAQVQMLAVAVVLVASELQQAHLVPILRLNQKSLCRQA
jgi:hypothetical protein